MERNKDSENWHTLMVLIIKAILKEVKCQVKDLYTMDQNGLLIRETGNKINFMDMEYCIMRPLWSWTVILITTISIWLKIFGLGMKVCIFLIQVHSIAIINLEKASLFYQMEKNFMALLKMILSMGKEFSLPKLEKRFRDFGKIISWCSSMPE